MAVAGSQGITSSALIIITNFRLQLSETNLN